MADENDPNPPDECPARPPEADGPVAPVPSPAAPDDAVQPVPATEAEGAALDQLIPPLAPPVTAADPPLVDEPAARQEAPSTGADIEAGPSAATLHAEEPAQVATFAAEVAPLESGSPAPEPTDLVQPEPPGVEQARFDPADADLAAETPAPAHAETAPLELLAAEHPLSVSADAEPVEAASASEPVELAQPELPHVEPTLVSPAGGDAEVIDEAPAAETVAAEAPESEAVDTASIAAATSYEPVTLAQPVELAGPVEDISQQVIERPEAAEDPLAAAPESAGQADEAMALATQAPRDPSADASANTEWEIAAERAFEPPEQPAEELAAELAASADAAPAPEGEAPRAEEALPPNYFRAAGDPEEPVEAPQTFWSRIAARAAALAGRVRQYFEPRLVALAGDTRAFAGEIWRHMRGIKHPRTVREAAVWGGWAAASFTALLVGFFVFVTWDMPSPNDLWEARNGQSITVLDRNGNVILREGAQNAPPVDLESLPPFVAQAFIAIEDRRFHDHWGVDFEGMMRAGAQNIRAGRVVQGGSTITQQLAKNLFLTNERSWRRKAQEIALAIWLETKFTKDEVLALYLSRVYFGAGAYGIEAAAERYFDRPARQLTLLQSAMIAGLVKAPSRLNPARQDIEAARERAEIVLTEMVSMGFISDAESQAAQQEELVISRRNPAGVLAYYRDWIDPLLNDVIGTQLDDFIIETTIDIQAQRAGAEAVEAVLAEQGESRRVGQAALISLDDEGGVIAMVGGRDYEQSQFNRATQARRQPGSAFKYFIYLAAMESGITPWSVREDGPLTIREPGQPDWSPGNYEDKYHGPSELAEAFQHSYNAVAIRVAHEVGGEHVIDVARRLGIRSQLHDYHSLSLGAQEVTLLELTQAYGAMASEGYRIEPHGVVRIRRAHDDETMWSWRQRNGRERVIQEVPLRYMNYMMSRVVEGGTGTRARMSGRQIGGKTGTGNEYRDAWFVGFTPGIVTGVWVGNDNFSETARVTGGSLPADIWARFMPTALRDIPVRDLQMPRPEDYDAGAPDPAPPSLTAVGAPLGGGSLAPSGAAPDDSQDRSLDLGPEG